MIVFIEENDFENFGQYFLNLLDVRIEVMLFGKSFYSFCKLPVFVLFV